MSKLDSAEKMLHETIAKLSHEVDRLSVKIKEIPILENNSNDIYAKDYFYYYDNDKHIYNKEKAIENYNKFIKYERKH